MAFLGRHRPVGPARSSKQRADEERQDRTEHQPRYCTLLLYTSDCSQKESIATVSCLLQATNLAVTSGGAHGDEPSPTLLLAILIISDEQVLCLVYHAHSSAFGPLCSTEGSICPRDLMVVALEGRIDGLEETLLGLQLHLLQGTSKA